MSSSIDLCSVSNSLHHFPQAEKQEQIQLANEYINHNGATATLVHCRQRQINQKPAPEFTTATAPQLASMKTQLIRVNTDTSLV